MILRSIAQFICQYVCTAVSESTVQIRYSQMMQTDKRNCEYHYPTHKRKSRLPRRFFAIADLRSSTSALLLASVMHCGDVQFTVCLPDLVIGDVLEKLLVGVCSAIRCKIMLIRFRCLHSRNALGVNCGERAPTCDFRLRRFLGLH